MLTNKKLKLYDGEYRVANRLLKDKEIAQKGLEAFVLKDFLLSVGIIRIPNLATKSL